MQYKYRVDSVLLSSDSVMIMSDVFIDSTGDAGRFIRVSKNEKRGWLNWYYFQSGGSVGETIEDCTKYTEEEVFQKSLTGDYDYIMIRKLQIVMTKLFVDPDSTFEYKESGILEIPDEDL